MLEFVVFIIFGMFVVCLVVNWIVYVVKWGSFLCIVFGEYGVGKIMVVMFYVNFNFCVFYW